MDKDGLLQSQVHGAQAPTSLGLRPDVFFQEAANMSCREEVTQEDYFFYGNMYFKTW